MPSYIVTIKVQVTADTPREAYEVGCGAFEHLLETFNDDDSIGSEAEISCQWPVTEH